MAVLTKNLIRKMIKEEMTTRHLREAEHDAGEGSPIAAAGQSSIEDIASAIVDILIDGAEVGALGPAGVAASAWLSDETSKEVVNIAKDWFKIGTELAVKLGVEWDSSTLKSHLNDMVVAALGALPDEDGDGVADMLQGEPEGEPEDIIPPEGEGEEGGTAAMEEPEEGLSLNERLMRAWLPLN